MDKIPSRTAMQDWTLLAVQRLGGSGHNDEIDEEVKTLLDLHEEESERLYSDGRRTVLAHRVAFARSHLKTGGFLENPQRAIWALTETGVQRAADFSTLTQTTNQELASPVDDQDDEDAAQPFPDGEEWKDDLLKKVQSLTPEAFERLCQRLLRESGFVQVIVTGRPGDGGIDGHGVLQMARLVSFPVMFQCKRWQGSVGSSVVRDFRGAMQGRADRGLIITTSTFTSDARKEAIRDGAPPIDLVDGLALADNLRELNLGVKEIIAVNHSWFDELQSWSDDAPPEGHIFGLSGV